MEGRALKIKKKKKKKRKEKKKKKKKKSIHRGLDHREWGPAQKGGVNDARRRWGVEGRSWREGKVEKERVQQPGYSLLRAIGQHRAPTRKAQRKG